MSRRCHNVGVLASCCSAGISPLPLAACRGGHTSVQILKGNNLSPSLSGHSLVPSGSWCDPLDLSWMFPTQVLDRPWVQSSAKKCCLTCLETKTHLINLCSFQLLSAIRVHFIFSSFTFSVFLFVITFFKIRGPSKVFTFFVALSIILVIWVCSLAIS